MKDGADWPTRAISTYEINKVSLDAERRSLVDKEH